MSIWRLLLCGGATLVLGLALMEAAADPGAPVQNQRQPKKVEAQPRQVQGGGGDLVSAKGLEKLKLTTEQNEKFAKINQEFQAKQKELQSQMEAAKKDRDRNKLTEAMAAQKKLRPDYLTRLEGILTDGQKKTLDELGREDPRARPNVGAGRPGAAVTGQLLPPQLQEKLKLTDEQRKKLTDLQKDVETKIRHLLTEGQRKLLDETKKPVRRPKETDLTTGDAAPDFTVQDMEGKRTVKLSELKGKPVVLIFGSCT